MVGNKTLTILIESVTSALHCVYLLNAFFSSCTKFLILGWRDLSLDSGQEPYLWKSNLQVTTVFKNADFILQIIPIKRSIVKLLC